MSIESNDAPPFKLTAADLAWIFGGGVAIAIALNVAALFSLPYIINPTANTAFQEAVSDLVFGALAYSVFLIVFYVRLTLRRGATLFELGVRSCPRNFIAMGFMAALLWLCITAILYTGIGLWDVTLAQGRALFAPYMGSLPAFVLFCVLAGPLAAICEEVLFRGLLFRWLRQRWSFGPAALVSGLIFAFIHPYLYVDSPALFIAFLFDLVAISVILAFLFEISKSLWPSIIAHAANNLLLIAIQFYLG
ncbi:MAG: CPBP family intramembrane glutamic endopeptidase [Alphaproteobacteria bacterium]